MNTRVIKLPQYKHLFYGILLVTLVSAGLYVYGVQKTVRNIIARQAVESSLSAISIQTSEDEFAYIDESNSIDMVRATNLGFTPVEANTFVARNPNVAMVNGAAHN